MRALVLLAQSAPSPISLGWQGDLFSAALLVLIALNIWDKLKRKPAIDEIFDRKLVAMSEATEKRMHLQSQESEKRMQSQSEQTDKKIDALDRRRENGEKEIRELVHDQISQLEKFISKQITDNRTNHTEQFGFLRGELHAVRGSMQALSSEVSRAVGRLEGADKTTR
jgi:hypothetical protein